MTDIDKNLRDAIRRAGPMQWQSTVNLPFLFVHLAIVEQCDAMPTFSELYPICLLLIAFLSTGWVILHRYPMLDDVTTRDIQLDGLRALLAFGVVVNHYFYIHDVINLNEFIWVAPQLSNLVGLSGSFSVSIFFGITAYLFSSRFTMIGTPGIVWLRFFVGRFFRLVPVCILCAIILLLMMNRVFFDHTTGADIKENWLSIINLSTSSIRRGPGFIGKPGDAIWMFAAPTGAHWTLHYEWLFYGLLPTIGFVSQSNKRVVWLIISILLMTVLMKGGKEFFVNWHYATWAFIPGLLLGLTHKHWKSDKYLSHPLTAAIALASVIASAFYDKLQLKIPANTLFLAIVLNKNSATRILESKLLRSLGETTYSIYLLHGLAQYATLRWIVTIPIARSLPIWLWWMTCALQIIVIVIVARLSFEYVEKPGIEAGKRFYTWLIDLIDQRAKWLLNWI